jgi:hypothetical protein
MPRTEKQMFRKLDLCEECKEKLAVNPFMSPKALCTEDLSKYRQMCNGNHKKYVRQRKHMEKMRKALADKRALGLVTYTKKKGKKIRMSLDVVDNPNNFYIVPTKEERIRFITSQIKYHSEEIAKLNTELQQLVTGIK